MLTDEDDAVVREQLKKHGIFEAHRVLAEYRCFRHRTDGEIQEVAVQVRDMGPDNPNARYSLDVWVPREDDRDCLSANASDSLIGALHTPHWRLLESRPLTTPPREEAR